MLLRRSPGLVPRHTCSLSEDAAGDAQRRQAYGCSTSNRHTPHVTEARPPCCQPASRTMPCPFAIQRLQPPMPVMLNVDKHMAVLRVTDTHHTLLRHSHPTVNLHPHHALPLGHTKAAAAHAGDAQRRQAYGCSTSNRHTPHVAEAWAARCSRPATCASPTCCTLAPPPLAPNLVVANPHWRPAAPPAPAVVPTPIPLVRCPPPSCRRGGQPASGGADPQEVQRVRTAGGDGAAANARGHPGHEPSEWADQFGGGGG